jgi:hypothetical protein
LTALLTPRARLSVCAPDHFPLHAGGSQGKTQLVLNYLSRHEARYTLCVWIGADELHESCSAALSALGTKPDPARAAEQLGALIRAHAGAKLLVVDNADTIKWGELSPLLPEGDGHVVVTTRNRELLETATRGGVLELSPFSEAEALAVLGVDAATPGALGLVRFLGCLPLAVGHARSSMQRSQQTAAEMLTTLQTVDASGASAGRAELERAYSPGVLAAFDLSVRNAMTACAAVGISRRAPWMAAIACGYLHAERIPRWFLRLWLQRVSNLREEDADVVLEQLVQFSLLTVRESAGDDGREGELYDMHRILQAAMRAQDPSISVLHVLTRRVALEFRYNHRATEHTHAEQLCPHAESCVAHARAAGARLSVSRQLDMALIATWLQDWLKFRGVYAQVRRWACRRN